MKLLSSTNMILDCHTGERAGKCLHDDHPPDLFHDSCSSLSPDGSLELEESNHCGTCDRKDNTRSRHYARPRRRASINVTTGLTNEKHDEDLFEKLYSSLGSLDLDDIGIEDPAQAIHSSKKSLSLFTEDDETRGVRRRSSRRIHSSNSGSRPTMRRHASCRSVTRVSTDPPGDILNDSGSGLSHTSHSSGRPSLRRHTSVRSIRRVPSKEYSLGDLHNVRTPRRTDDSRASEGLIDPLPRQSVRSRASIRRTASSRPSARSPLKDSGHHNSDSEKRMHDSTSSQTFAASVTGEDGQSHSKDASPHESAASMDMSQASLALEEAGARQKETGQRPSILKRSSSRVLWADELNESTKSLTSASGYYKREVGRSKSSSAQPSKHPMASKSPSCSEALLTMSNSLSSCHSTGLQRTVKGLNGAASRDNKPTLPSRSCHDARPRPVSPPRLRRCASLRGLPTRPTYRTNGDRREDSDSDSDGDDTTVSFHEDEVAELAITSVEPENPLDSSLSHVEEVETWISQLKFKRHMQDERIHQKHQGAEFFPVSAQELVRSLHRSDHGDESRVLQRLTPTPSLLDDDDDSPDDDHHQSHRSFALQLGMIDPDRLEVLVARAVSDVAEQAPLNHLDDAAFDDEEADQFSNDCGAPRRWESGGAVAEKFLSLPSRVGPRLGKSMFTHLRATAIHPSYGQAL